MTLPDEFDWRTATMAALADALLSVRNRREVELLMRDLCTRRELEEMGKRWEVAQLLDEDLSYREISERTGVSTTTVTRISQWLHHGTGGYRLALDRTKRGQRRKGTGK